MCDRMARKDGKELPMKFWEQLVWKRTFLLQVRQANSLLKLFDLKAIVQALRTPQGKKVFSLGARWLIPVIQIEQEKMGMQELIRKEFEEDSLPPEPKPELPVLPNKQRPSFSAKKTQLSKLKELE